MNRSAPWILVVGAALLYGGTAAPGLYWDDAGEVLAAAEYGAVLHPPGHAFPALVGWCASRLAGGGIAGARAVNLLCALVAAAAAGLWFKVLIRWMPSPVDMGLAWGTALSVVVGTSLWRFGTSAEVYGWVLLFLSAGLLVLPRGLVSRRGDWAAGYVAALGAATHAMLVPVGVIVCAARLVSRREGRMAATGRLLVGGLLGATPLLFLPIRGRIAQEGSWGAPDSVQGFVDHLLAKDFAPELVGGTHRLGTSSADVATKWMDALGQQGPIPLLVLGFVFLLAGRGPWERSTRGALLGIVAATSVIATQVGGGIVLDAYVMPVAWILLLSGGVGLAFVLARFPRWLRCGATGLLLAWAANHAAETWGERDLSTFQGTRLYAEAIVAASPPGSVLLLENSMDYFAVVGFQAVHRRRVDLVPVFVPTLGRPWSHERLVARIGKVPMEGMRELAVQIEALGRPVLYGPSDRFRFPLASLRARGPLFAWTELGLLPEAAEEAFSKFVEAGAGSDDSWYRRRVALVSAHRAEHAAAVGDLPGAIDEQRRAVELDLVGLRAWYNLAVLLERAERWQDARDAFENALAIEPSRACREGLGRTELGLGRVEAGIRIFRDLVDEHVDDAALRYNLGTACLRAGRFSEAASELRLVTELDPGRVLAWNNLGLALLADGRPLDARRTWAEGLRRFPDHAGLARNILGLEGGEM